jgi:hypothetical protein
MYIWQPWARVGFTRQLKADEFFMTPMKDRTGIEEEFFSVEFLLKT